METINSNSTNLDPIDLLSLHWKLKSKAAATTGSSSSPSPSSTAKESKPSHLNTLNSSGLFQLVSTDKMSVQYIGAQHHDHDVGAAQADCHAPAKKTAYYFEMTVRNAGDKGQVAIGFTGKDYKLRRQPGWEANSCGYHGDDGFIYRGHGRGEAFGPKYTTGDTVGAGINYAAQEFFTKNGKIVGTIEKDIKGPLYPTVAVHSQNEELENPSFKLLGIILVISVGVLSTVARETQSEFWGFLFVMLAAVMSRFRWCMTQILLQKEAYGFDSIFLFQTLVQ